LMVGINDTPVGAGDGGKLQDILCHVNLIP
jgi:hypothetical protein